MRKIFGGADPQRQEKGWPNMSGVKRTHSDSRFHPQFNNAGSNGQAGATGQGMYKNPFMQFNETADRKKGSP